MSITEAITFVGSLPWWSIPVGFVSIAIVAGIMENKL